MGMGPWARQAGLINFHNVSRKRRGLDLFMRGERTNGGLALINSKTSRLFRLNIGYFFEEKAKKRKKLLLTRKGHCKRTLRTHLGLWSTSGGIAYLSRRTTRIANFAPARAAVEGR